MSQAVYVISGINPEPWVAPEGAIGRNKGKLFIQFYKSSGLTSYQEAVREELRLQNGLTINHVPLDEPVQITFWLWRELAQSDDKDSQRNVADATNMQKALEDALQGILYENDKKNVDIRTVIVEQSKETFPEIQIEVLTGEHRSHAVSPRPHQAPIYGATPMFPRPDKELF